MVGITGRRLGHLTCRLTIVARGAVNGSWLPAVSLDGGDG
jgi:hypothetical protein